MQQIMEDLENLELRETLAKELSDMDKADRELAQERAKRVMTPILDKLAVGVHRAIYE